MKKETILLAAIALSIAANAQQIDKNESALVYYLPKTEVMLEVEYERVDAKVGMFYQYAQRYLGLDDIVKENKVTYKIKNISFQTRTIPDKSRAYAIRNSNYNIGISLTEDGILCGINARNKDAVNNKFDYKTGVYEETRPQKTYVPLGEEQILSGSQAKMAESTAKQIYRIRENRFNLLSGEVENMPTESEAVKLILEQMQQQEDALCELFTGTKTVTTHYAYYPIDFNKENNKTTLFRFSTLSGPVDASDLSGSPITVTIEQRKPDFLSTQKEKKASKDAIYYNVPGDASITVMQGNQILAQKDLKVAQLGIAVPLETAWLFKKILINPETGLVSQVN